MILEKQVLANKYARAFYDLFKSEIDTNQVHNMLEIYAFLEENKNILVCMQLGLINQNVADIFKELFSKSKMPDSFNRIINLLLHDTRISLLPDIFKSLANLFFQEKNILITTIESSHKLTDTQKQTFLNFFAEQTGQKIILKERINTELIAGIKIYSDTKAWQYNVKNQIKSLDYAKNKST